MRMETNEFYLRSPEEMYSVFAGNEDAVRRTQEIADRWISSWSWASAIFPCTSRRQQDLGAISYELCVEG